MKRSLLLAVLLLLAGLGPGEASTPARRRRPPKPLDIVWHVEAPDGTVIDSRRGDEPVNPASVMKVATTLWALETLGPETRFETRAYLRGTLDRERRVLKGDLIVRGGRDPDFHPENAILLAASLNELGIERVTGALIVDHAFSIGWENGSAGRNPDPGQRGLLMATRLRQAFDPKRWNGLVRGAWRELAARRGLDARTPPRIVVGGGVGVDGAGAAELLAIHRSQPLLAILKRFNCHSNNDIERLVETLGRLDELAALLAARTGADPASIAVETASGLGTNRLTPRTIVRLLAELARTCERLGLRPEDVLPLSGCDPGTVESFFPQLSAGGGRHAVVAKTGTLTATDGGVSVLAGFASTAKGTALFCVAVPAAGGRLGRARKAEEEWVLQLLASQGGARPLACRAELPAPDVGAAVILVERVLPPLAAAAP